MSAASARHGSAILVEACSDSCRSGKINGLPGDQRQERPEEQPRDDLLRNRRVGNVLVFETETPTGGDVPLELWAATSCHCEL